MTEIKDIKLSNGNIQHCRVVDDVCFEVGMTLADGTYEDYSHTVNDSLINTILRCMNNRERIRVWLGDTKTGRSWNEEYDVTGRIGRSTGTYKIPLLVNNRRSYGGGALLVDAIVRIDSIEDRRTLWSVDNFHVEPMKVIYKEGENYPFQVMQKKDGETDYTYNIANFKKVSSAIHWVDFMTGKRYCK